MPKDDAEKAAKKARKEAKRAEAAAATANAPKLAVGTNLVQDVEMGDASKSAADKVRYTLSQLTGWLELICVEN